MSFLGTYLSAIGLPDAATAEKDLDLLQRVYMRHGETLGFTTLHLLTKDSLANDPQSALQKIVELKHGGVCGEHCPLMLQALLDLGYKATLRGGEVNQPVIGWSDPASHKLVTVDMGEQGIYLLDVGFPMKPLNIVKLVADVEQVQTNGVTVVMTYDAAIDTWYYCIKGPDGSLNQVHRFRMIDFSAEDLAKGNEMLYNESTAFQTGWMFQINKPDGSVVTMANGSWAGQGVSPDQVKYVIRPPALAPEIAELIPLGSERVAQLATEEFLIDASVKVPTEPLKQPPPAPAAATAA